MPEQNPLPKPEFLELGQLVEVDVPAPVAGPATVYYCQIMDFDARQILISIPQRKGLVAGGLSPEQILSLRVFLSDASYACTCRVLAWQEQPQGLRLSLPLTAERIQRRNFVRVDAELPVVLQLPEEQSAGREFQGSTLDLSGGGLMLISDFSLPLESRLSGRLYLPSEKISENLQDFDILNFEAEVCRCEAQQSNYLLGLSFLDLAENLQDRLVRYIFRYQRESLQKRVHLNI